MSHSLDRSPDFGDIYDFVFPLEPSDKAKLIKLHAVRDASATTQVLPPLLKQGFEYAGPIFNRRPGPRLLRGDGDEDREPAIVPVDYSFLRSSDLLVQACRPPMDDHHSGTRKRVPRSYTDLEQILIDGLRPYIEYCARDKVCVASQFRPLLRGDFANRREMEFHLNGCGAAYRRLNAHNGRGPRDADVGNRTALFLLRLEEAWPGGPGYVCAFGLDGLCTYVWSYRLGKDFQHLLARPGFAMAELEVRAVPEYPLTMDWCRDWKIELLFVHEFGSQSRVRRVARG
ncbi:MAG: hypothetical protein EXS08_16020 [Planctomycetes bacterium]|nr:hypothetical protein [Planctomycetota bacterium]